jgi:ubiquinone/menaquinone biosynthesis C-methylase UbiE
MTEHKKEVAEQFGRMSDAYASSEGHAKGRDLNIVLSALNPSPRYRVLDIATGAGHTAVFLAPHVASVLATDMSLRMIQRAHELAVRSQTHNVRLAIMDAEQLAVPTGAFDAVTCRIAAHHFENLAAAVHEAARAIAPDGCLVFEDSCAPSEPVLDEFTNELERHRDPTHVRSYTVAEWESCLRAAGLAMVEKHWYRKRHDIDSWLERAGADLKAQHRVIEHVLGARDDVRSYFEIRYEHEHPVSFTDDKLIFRAQMI